MTDKDYNYAILTLQTTFAYSVFLKTEKELVAAGRIPPDLDQLREAAKARQLEAYLGGMQDTVVPSYFESQREAYTLLAGKEPNNIQQLREGVIERAKAFTINNMKSTSQLNYFKMKLDEYKEFSNGTLPPDYEKMERECAERNIKWLESFPNNENYKEEAEQIRRHYKLPKD